MRPLLPLKALVSIAIILVTAGVVVVGANAVTGEKGSDSISVPTSRATVDPACEANPPDGNEANCLPLDWFTLPEQPDRTPIGLKPAECPPDLLELDPEICDGLENVLIPDFGPNVPTITINGRTVTLPEDVTISGMAWQGQRVTIASGESWVKYSPDGVLVDSYIAPGEEEKMQPIVDALKR